MENNHDGQHWLGELSPRWAWRTVTLRDCFQNFSNPIQPCRVPQHHTAMLPSLPPNQWGKKKNLNRLRCGVLALQPLCRWSLLRPQRQRQHTRGLMVQSWDQPFMSKLGQGVFLVVDSSTSLDDVVRWSMVDQWCMDPTPCYEGCIHNLLDNCRSHWYQPPRIGGWDGIRDSESKQMTCRPICRWIILDSGSPLWGVQKMCPANIQESQLNERGEYRIPNRQHLYHQGLC